MSVPFESIEVLAQRLARHIAEQTPDGWQFVLHLVQQGEGGFATYVSNVQRETAIRFHVEWLERMKVDGQYLDTDITDACWCCGGKRRLRTFRGPQRMVSICRQCLARQA